MILGRFAFASLLCAAVVIVPGSAQVAGGPAAKAAPVSRYLDPKPMLLFEALVPPPPEPGSSQALEDLAAVHRLQTGRTASEIEAAQRDDRNESIFAFSTILDPRFVSSSLPLTTALSQHLREESGVVNPSLKVAFNRPRPFITDATVNPVCERTATNSYPSGHAMVGYLEAFALAQMIPEKAGSILQRANAYARNRVICGVHYPSDVEASHILASALFGALAASPRFREELAAAKAEVREHLALQP